MQFVGGARTMAPATATATADAETGARNGRGGRVRAVESDSRREQQSMARGVNKAILVGNLGADPETRYSASGGAITNLRIATTESWTDRQSNERREQTEWHRVVMFGRLAEIAEQYLRKGRQVYIEGKIQTRKWQGQDGQDRYTTEIVARDMQMLGGGGEGGGGADDWNRPAAGPPRNQGPPEGGAPGRGAMPPAGGNDPDIDDDIPF